VVWLSESHRFAADSGIGRLAALVNAGDSAAALEWMAACRDGSVSWIDDGGQEPAPGTRRRIVDGYAGYIEALRRGADPPEVFAAFDRFRVLCALRDTARGVGAMNALLAAHLRAALDHPLDPGGASPWFPGRPVMVLGNDYGLRLFNGDIGLCLPDGQGGLMAWFAAPDGGLRRIAPARLPAHDTAFATTVHKAQGSEFESVLLLLPDRAAKVMVRELVYTAVTRAAKSVTVVGPADVFRTACDQPTRRHAGLIDRMDRAAGRSGAIDPGPEAHVCPD
jgi:exodeoxyribonuclease V alpha subunit